MLVRYFIDVTDLDRSGPIDHGDAIAKLYVNIDGCRSLYEKALASGAKSTMEPMSLEKWPVTIAWAQHPDGYAVQIVAYHES